VIAFDYDNTLTQFALPLIQLSKTLQSIGETTVIVTLRFDHERDAVFNQVAKSFNMVFCTGQKAKRPFMESKGHHVKLWIDDTPEYILHDFGAVLSFDELNDKGK
jgi:hypothetical protein